MNLPNVEMSLYQCVQEHQGDHQDYWAKEAEKLIWVKKWDRILDISRPPLTKWFQGGLFNICYNCLDRHVEQGKGNKMALICDSPVTSEMVHLTYAELKNRVEKFAWTLSDLGVGFGDRVIIYMPRIAEGVVAMLACSRIGAIQCALYTGLPAIQIAQRINLFEPKVIVTSNIGFQNGRPIDLKTQVDEAISLSEFKPKTCLIVRRLNMDNFKLVPGRDVLWETLEPKAETMDCVPIEATAPLYILQTSGTTGEPKAVVIASAGFAVKLSSHFRSLYGDNEDEIFFTTSEFGWQVAQNYICYGGFLHGGTSVLYEGDHLNTPDKNSFFRLIDQHKITRLITNVSTFRGIRKTNPNEDFGKEYDLSSLRDVMVTGEAIDVGTMKWASEVFRAPVIDGYGQTESGGFISSIYPEPPKEETTVFPASLVCHAWNVEIVNTVNMKKQPVNVPGRVLIKLPLPPGAISTLWNREELFFSVYFGPFPGYYDTKDEGLIEANGALRILGRMDDVIKVGSMPVVCAVLEETILKHQSIAECVVVAVSDVVMTHVPLALYCVKNGVSTSEHDLSMELVKLVDEKVTKNSCIRVVQVKELPKTFSGKTDRSVIKALVKGSQIANYDDQGIILGIKETLNFHGFINK